MDKKRYGVHNDLLQSLKDFQISLRRTTMPFVTLANVSINSGEALRLNIQAEGGRISIPEFPLGPRGLQRFRPPRQTLIEIGTTKGHFHNNDGKPERRIQFKRYKLLVQRQ
nr:PREDICTED: uncharacterized protein LOC107397691 isoform X3 [Tribolium castaneum]|eukprot:XP_015834208.1 PREDICTED: uncharacterized protein LOC107397691 isoform X3 [Tribolium castaneum]